MYQISCAFVYCIGTGFRNAASCANLARLLQAPKPTTDLRALWTENEGVFFNTGTRLRNAGLFFGPRRAMDKRNTRVQTKALPWKADYPEAGGGHAWRPTRCGGCGTTPTKWSSTTAVRRSSCMTTRTARRSRRPIRVAPLSMAMERGAVRRGEVLRPLARWHRRSAPLRSP